MPAPPNRIVTIPNVISIVRLALVPVFLYLLWGADKELAAGLLAAGLGATDWVDGYIARHFDPEWIAELRRRGHDIDVVTGYRHGPGIAHAIECMSSGYRAGSDPRAEGGVAGL